MAPHADTGADPLKHDVIMSHTIVEDDTEKYTHSHFVGGIVETLVHTKRCWGRKTREVNYAQKQSRF
jgi:hypothetical protein